MNLFYIDESGTGLKDTRSPFFVLCAISIDVNDWRAIDDKVIELKRELISWAKPEDFEIKGRDLRRGEKLFKNQSWETRSRAIIQIAELLAEVSCQIYAVQVDTRDLPDYVATDNDLYRIAFWRLLDVLDTSMMPPEDQGMLMVDMRSDMHSSVQDRRLIDAYREWLSSRGGKTKLIETPWFGFSAFYAGLQLADYCAYLIDFVTNEVGRMDRTKPMLEAYSLLMNKITLVRIP